MEEIWQNVRFGLRALRKNPGFTAFAILTLALGIGLNTAMFSLGVNIVLRPLPVSRPSELVAIGCAAVSDPECSTTTGIPRIYETSFFTS